MQGNPKVIAALNDALKAELTAISQYMLHGEMCRNWGYEWLHAVTQKRSIDEMKHAEDLIERLLFLDAAPQMAELDPMKIGASVKAQLESDLALEQGAVASYNAAVRTCTEAGDAASRLLFEKLLADEEGHLDWIETQLFQIGEIGLERYLTQQVRKGE
jgi:bacterioferritin